MDFVVIKKNGMFYCRYNTDYPSDIPSEDRVRFDVSREPSFDAKWAVFKEMPSKVENFIPGRSIIIKYKLKAGYCITSKTPSELPTDSFNYINDCDRNNGDIYGLYNKILENTESKWEEINSKFTLIDEDCEPLVNPKYPYVVKFPYYIENHEAVQHKYPCKIKGTELYKLIKTAVKENLPDHCNITSDYDFHFAVSVSAKVIHDELYTVDDRNFNARKPKYVQKPLRTIGIELINIKTEGNYNSTMISDVSAENYAELEQKVDNIIKEYVDSLSFEPVVCPHCKGYGLEDIN